MENLYTPDCIRTFTGKYVNVFEPTPEMICIEDIAHALAQQPRFGGHLPTFYSVASHSLNCSYLAETSQEKLEALMHDASEAYLLDIPSPIKKRLNNYKEIEHRLMVLIGEKFGFQWPMSDTMVTIDESMLVAEWNYLMLKKESWKINLYDEKKTEWEFLRTFVQLQAEISVKKMETVKG